MRMSCWNWKGETDVATVWYDHYAKCPYYRHSDCKHEVVCDGMIEKSKQIHRFDYTEDLLIQVKTFCCDKYKNCEVYGMLKQIYEDDDNG